MFQWVKKIFQAWGKEIDSFSQMQTNKECNFLSSKNVQHMISTFNALIKKIFFVFKNLIIQVQNHSKYNLKN